MKGIPNVVVEHPDGEVWCINGRTEAARYDGIELPEPPILLMGIQLILSRGIPTKRGGITGDPRRVGPRLGPDRGPQFRVLSWQWISRIPIGAKVILRTSARDLVQLHRRTKRTGVVVSIGAPVTILGHQDPSMPGREV